MPIPASHPAPSVSREELRAKMRVGTVRLVDVLPRDSFLGGHIPGALHLPLGDIPLRARQVLPDLDTEIIAYCGGNT